MIFLRIFKKILASILCALIIVTMLVVALYDNGYVITYNNEIVAYLSESINIEEKLNTDFGYIEFVGDFNCKQMYIKKHLISNANEFIENYGTKFYKYWAIYVDNEEKLCVYNENEANQMFEQLDYDSSINHVTMAQTYAEILPAESSQNEFAELDQVLIKNYAYSFQKPIKSPIITSRYGNRHGEFHTGLDMATQSGQPIYAAQNGKIIFAGVKGNYGNLIIIEHKFGYETYYAHCSALLVSAGTQVKQGQKIALVGSTGRSTGPHVHFEIRYNGITTNPYTYIYSGNF